MKRVIIESPYAGNIERNVEYARRAMRHSLSLGEAPIASHLLYTQVEVLSDHHPDDREKGIGAGYAWWDATDLIVFYVDYGWSRGMLAALNRAITRGLQFGNDLTLRHIGKNETAL